MVENDNRLLPAYLVGLGSHTLPERLRVPLEGDASRRVLYVPLRDIVLGPYARTTDGSSLPDITRLQAGGVWIGRGGVGADIGSLMSGSDREVTTLSIAERVFDLALPLLGGLPKTRHVLAYGLLLGILEE
ncbi:MAG: hypothetical protein Q7S65_00075 [Nanoarchaeota archaeon]|nr:hypothetical protein [Nanoarchaeota archaeon]